MWPALNEDFLAAAAATMNFHLGEPVVLATTDDGAVLFRRTPARSFASDLFELNTATGEIVTLATAASLLAGGNEQLSDAEKARRERTRTATKGIVSIDVSKDGRRVLVPLGERLFVIGRGPKPSTVEVKIGDGFPYDPHLAPDGSQVAFVRDGDLWLASIDGNLSPRRLTKHPLDIEYAVADFAAQEELDRTRGYWWSPDSKSIVLQRTDARAVDTLYVADSRHPDKAPVPFKYPRAGRNNAVVDLGIISVSATTETNPTWLTWNTAEFPYLAQVMWTSGTPLAFTVVNREQTEIQMLVVDTATHSLRMMHSEKDAAWVNLAKGAPRWLEDGSGYLWMSEASGQWQLERYDASGKRLAVLTEPSLGLQSLAGVDEKAGVAYVNASADSRQSHVYRVSLASGGAAIAMTDVAKGGINVASASRGIVVIDSLKRDGGTTKTATTSSGKSFEIPSVAERPSISPTTTMETVRGDSPANETIYTTITRPHNFDGSRKYPVLLKVYAGPHKSMVVDSRDAYIMDQWYADAGFIVVRADGRGTPGRGRAWERAILKDLITVPLHDQVTALQAMGAAHPEMDMKRVGIFGWSFGGYFSTMAVLMHPEVFRAAIAGAPVTDWQLYDTAYTERYLKTPASNPDGYQRSSAMTYAGKLLRPLLIIHGITDDNVHFAHTLALIEALYLEGKRSEVVTLSATHMVPDPKLNLAREKVQIDFFRQHLATHR
jgi:dipeptidyl-peptidase 4